jgi:uncharacterized membrane protein
MRVLVVIVLVLAAIYLVGFMVAREKLENRHLGKGPLCLALKTMGAGKVIMLPLDHIPADAGTEITFQCHVFARGMVYAEVTDQLLSDPTAGVRTVCSGSEVAGNDGPWWLSLYGIHVVRVHHWLRIPEDLQPGRHVLHLRVNDYTQDFQVTIEPPTQSPASGEPLHAP